jgi:hypothetical protein
MNIIFTDTTASGLDQPQPASRFIPDWYKNMDSYMGGVKKPDGNGVSLATIKRCMPVFDAINAGYIITLPVDIWVSIKEFVPTSSETGEEIKDLPVKKDQYFEWSNFNLVDFHPIEQAPTHPARNDYQYPKWINPWAIRTPKGYSTMFVQPMHRESVFTILPGIVDTDEYSAPVNFPFVINDPDFQGIIPKGTPIAQVIPFKRESWNLEIGDEKELREVQKVNSKLTTKFFDRYKTMFRATKNYS